MWRFVTVLRIDGGGEYSLNEFEEFYVKNDIEHEVSPLYTSQVGAKNITFFMNMQHHWGIFSKSTCILDLLI